MSLRPEELAKTIEHTLLRPTATADDVERWCEEALENHFASVCVFPCYVRHAAERLRGADVKVSSVVSFPFGADGTRAKIAAAEECVTAGADELDVVMNLSAMLSGAFRLVQDELAALVRAARTKSANAGRGGLLVKVVVDSSSLSDELKRLACKIVEDAGADFVAVSTGFDGGASVRDVELLRECLSEGIAVKASAPVASLEDIHELVNAGAARVGTADAAAIMHSMPRRGA